MKETCKNLGIGLLAIGSVASELVHPIRGVAMPSVYKVVQKSGDQGKVDDEHITTRSSIVELFRSEAQVLILKLLLLNSTEEFHSNDIARKTGLAPSTVVKETPLLRKLGLIERHEKGNLVLYTINKDGVIYDELRRIFLKYELLDELLKENLPKSSLDYALISGSFAKGEEGMSSDLDLLIIGKASEDGILRSIGLVERKIGREVNYNLWSKEEFKVKARQKIPLLQEILKTPLIMIVGDETEFKRIIRQGAS